MEVMPVVKSNAYGHGMLEIAKLVEPKVKWLGVVNLDEALFLREQGIKKKILVLSYVDEKKLSQAVKKQIDLPVYDLSFAKKISQAAARIKKKANVHIKIDTGASRVGILPDQAVSFIKQVSNLSHLRIAGIYSHFASSEDDQRYTKKQLFNFNKVAQEVKTLGIKVPYYHFGCSAATLTTPASNYNMIRLGVSLYGLWPSVEAKKTVQKRKRNFNLKPALVWKTRILQVKEIPAGTKVGYGCSYTARKKMTMAVMAAGYWEGYDRHLSNRGVVIVKGKRCPIIGRICMNISMIDVSAVKNAKAGNEVILLGPNNSADEAAEKIGTINYEVVTRINPVLKRVYVK